MNKDLEKLRERSISKLVDQVALDHIGTLIDASYDAAYGRGADRALYLLDELAKRDLSYKDQSVLEYFRANAWSVKEKVDGTRRSLTWEHPAREQQILALSRAISHPGFAELDELRRCQMLTNRANLLNRVGRIVDAIEGWDEALKVIPRFALAQANRGYGLKHYGSLLDANRERAIFLLHAHDGLSAASAPGAVFDAKYSSEVLRQIAIAAQECASAGDLDRIRDLQDLGGPSLGRSKAELTYRRWCLDRRLFLNPINDLGAHTAAALDDLVLPGIVETFDDRPDGSTPPPAIGFFNQMKQEYVSARYFLYEGLQDNKLHFSDRGVQLFDTLDFPMHSLATERVRASFRIAYSILDKVAFLIDHYWKLGKIADRINFKNVWMVEGKPRLLERFKEHPNWPLRGLFWLSKELFDEQLKQAIAPDARELHDIRNALEHKYLRVHESWAWSEIRIQKSGDSLGLSIDSDLLEAKALRVMKITRSALIQLALAIGAEEKIRARERPDGPIGSMPLFELGDRRKRRDPS